MTRQLLAVQMHQVKRVSGKHSYTTLMPKHYDKVKNGYNFRPVSEKRGGDAGRPWRFHYLVKIYSKDSCDEV